MSEHPEGSSARQDAFFAAVASRHIVRVSVRAVILEGGRALAQTTRDGSSFYAFIVGEYELGDTFEGRIRKEIDEETNARLVSWRYLCVLENFFTHNGSPVQTLEHFGLATIDRRDVISREAHLVQEWLPIASL